MATVPVVSPFQVAWDRERGKDWRSWCVRGPCLAGAAGSTNTASARAQPLHLDSMRRWHRRFAAEGLAALEAPGPRTGRSPPLRP